jgi:hypothetical protein
MLQRMANILDLNFFNDRNLAVGGYLLIRGMLQRMTNISDLSIFNDRSLTVGTIVTKRDAQAYIMYVHARNIQNIN